MPTKIQWTDETWNSITGCTKVSPGCANCYAERMAKRLAGRFGYPADDPFHVTFHPDKLDKPTKWKKPRRIFVCSMSDLFHKDVPFEYIDEVFAVMALCQQHTFQVLTKRPERMIDYYAGPHRSSKIEATGWSRISRPIELAAWPLLNVWQGVTVENQAAADERIPLLLKCPAALRFVSCEPMLGPVEFGMMAQYPTHKLDQLILGPETGRKRRVCEPDWIRWAVENCVARCIPVFIKAFPVNGRVSKNMAEWPDWARRREFPQAKGA